MRARVVPYNFSSAGQISTDQLRAISMLNDLFARNLTHNLSAWLRTRSRSTWSPPSRFSSTSFCCGSRRSVMWPRCAWSRWERSPCCSWTWPGSADHRSAAGRRGASRGPLRELTDIEESIMGSVVEIVCRELTAAWQPVGLSFNFERRQMQTQVARIMPVTEKTFA
jgi:flagellar motor switch protein FliM